MKVFGMSAMATSLFSIVLIIDVKSMDSAARVGDDESSLDIKPHYLFPPATIWNSRILIFLVDDKSF